MKVVLYRDQSDRRDPTVSSGACAHSATYFQIGSQHKLVTLRQDAHCCTVQQSGAAGYQTQFGNGSAHSLEAVAFLQEHGILFEDVDARTAEGFARLLKRTQQDRVPAFELKRAHSVGVIVGLDKELLGKELGLRKQKTNQKTLEEFGEG